MLRGACCAILLLCAGSPFASAAQDYGALLDEAVNAIEWAIEDEWAFTETAVHGDELWVGRYDPRLAEDERWSLISVDGKQPTDRQQRKYRHDKDEHREDADDDDNRVTAIVEPDSLELVEETDDYWVFTFVPADDEAALIDSVDAMIRIRKDGRYVEALEMRNHQDIRPGYGTKITEFQMRFTFGPAVENGPVVQKSLDVRVTGRALLFIGFDETEVVKYSDFEFAGD